MFPHEYTLKYANFFTYFNGDILYVTYSNDKDIKKGDSIILINNMPYKTYINEFMKYCGGIQNDLMDMKYQSNFIFIDHHNPFFGKPVNITLDNNDIIKLNYVDYDMNTNVLDFFTYDMIDQNYEIYKKNKHIYIKINDFETIDYSDLIKLLPCNEITVNLQNNFGGSIYNVEMFFKIVYDIDIKLGIQFKLNKYMNNVSALKKIKKNFNEVKYCRKTIIEKYKNKISGPIINIQVNEYSRSSSKLFVEIVKLIIPVYKIYGDITTNNICGTIITIITSDYVLNIPTMCYVLNDN